jgi:hypothetical protein
MDEDERDVLEYLMMWGQDYINPKEISRRAAGRKRHSTEPDWAMPVLLLLVQKNLAEKNVHNHFRLKPEPKKKGHTRWVSPDINKILAEAGVKVEGAADILPEETAGKPQSHGH